MAVPEAGDQVNAAEDDKVAKQVVEHPPPAGAQARAVLQATVLAGEPDGSATPRVASKELKVVLKGRRQGLGRGGSRPR